MSLTYKPGKENECDNIWKGVKHKKLLNIKSINLIKSWLKFCSGSSLYSGKNSKLVSLSRGPSQSGPCLQVWTLPSPCSKPYQGTFSSFPRAPRSLTPFHTAPLLLLSFPKIQPKCDQEAFSDCNQLGGLYFLCNSTRGFPYHSVFHTGYFSRNCGRLSVTYLLPSIMGSFPAGMNLIHFCTAHAEHNTQHTVGTLSLL